jgi:superfamily I DNA/RNA helicase
MPISLPPAGSLETSPHPLPWALNDQQRAFVEAPGHSLCVACPGSGKTRTLIAKAYRLMQAHRIERVLALTFTRAAVTQMKHRLSQVLGARAQSAHIYTFHGLAYRQLVRVRKLRVVNRARRQTLLARV